jgi:hypothetical protein
MAADVIFQRDLHRLVEINRPADLATRIGEMVLLVDRCAFDLQKTPFASFLSRAVALRSIAGRSGTVQSVDPVVVKTDRVELDHPLGTFIRLVADRTRPGSMVANTAAA